MICGQHDHALGGAGEFFYAAFNMHTEALPFTLPALPRGWSWRLLADTGRPSPDDIFEAGSEPRLDGGPALTLIPKSCALCIGREDL